MNNHLSTVEESFKFAGANFRGLWDFCLFEGMLFCRCASFQL